MSWAQSRAWYSASSPTPCSSSSRRPLLLRAGLEPGSKSLASVTFDPGLTRTARRTRRCVSRVWLPSVASLGREPNPNAGPRYLVNSSLRLARRVRVRVWLPVRGRRWQPYARNASTEFVSSSRSTLTSHALHQGLRPPVQEGAQNKEGRPGAVQNEGARHAHQVPDAPGTPRNPRRADRPAGAGRGTARTGRSAT